MRDHPVKAWICTICGYIHYGDTPPEECPVCGAAGSMFEPYTEVSETAAASPAEKMAVVIIVGAGIAGVSAAEAIRKISSETRILLISEETEIPYYRLNLTRYLDGELSSGDLPLHPKQWYEEENIELRMGCKINSLNMEQKKVMTESGEALVYDRLILATGAHSFRPPIAGIERKNVFTLRSHADADAILAAAAGEKKCICIGGGILGLETAGALAHRGISVTVIEALPWLMPRQLNQNAAAIFENRVRRQGIALRTNMKTRELTGDDAIRGVLLEDGTLLPADAVILSAGVRSNVDLARSAGLLVNQGIVVDDRMQTSDPDVFAAGDAAEHRGVLYGTWMPSQLQGSIAGMSAVGQVAAFPGVPRSNTLKVLGIELFSIGLTAPEAPDNRLIEEQNGDVYFGFILRGSKLVGAVLLGDASASAIVRKVIEEKLDLPFQGEISVQEILHWMHTIH